MALAKKDLGASRQGYWGWGPETRDCGEGRGTRAAKRGAKAAVNDGDLERAWRAGAPSPPSCAAPGALGAAIAPKEIAFADALPRTRSGKILRRLLRARELGLPEGDVSTLEE